MQRSLLLAAILVPIFAAAAPAATVTVEALTETRSVQLNNRVSPLPPGVQVIVQISGDDVKGASGVGKFIVSEAKDDTGKDIAKPPFPGLNEAIKKLGEWEISKQDGSFQCVLNVGGPARGAKTVTIKGTLTVLAGGEVKESKVAKSAPAGQTIDDATLKAAGLTLTPRAKPAGSTDNSFQYDLVGSPDVITRVKFVGKDGKPLDANFSTYSSGQAKGTILNVIAYGKPADDAELVLTVVVGQKTVPVTVDLKDVNLP